MAKDEAKVKFTADTAEFTANIKQAESTLQQLRSELRLNTTELKGSGDSVDLLQNRLSILTQEQEAAREKTENINAKLEEAKRVFGENSTQVQTYTKQLNAAKNVEANIQNDIVGVNQALQKQKTATSELGKTVSESDKKIESLNSELDTNKAKIDSVSQKTNDFKTKLQNASEKTSLLKERQSLLAQQMETSGKKTDALKEALEKCGKEVGENSDEYRELKTQVNAAEKEQAGIQKEIASTTNELKEQKTSLQLAKDEFGGYGDKITSAAKTVAKLTVAAAAATTAIAALSTKVGVEFESAFAGVLKTVDGTTEQLEELREGILNMATEIPATTTEISAVAEAAGQLGIATEDVLEFTRVMVDLGESTNLSADEAASALAKFANITQMSADEYSNLGSTIVALGNNFATTEADIVNMATNLASAGSQVGMSQADIMALATALSSVGLEAQAGGTAFSKALTQIQVAVETNSDSLNNWASVAGMSAQEFATAFKEDATGALQAFIQGLSECGGETESAIVVLDEMGITETRMRDALLRSANASNVFSSAIEMGSQAWSENTALTNEAAQRYETLESKTQVLKNSISNLGVVAYDSMRDGLTTVVESATTAVGKLQNAFSARGLSGAFESAGSIMNGFFNDVTKGNTTLKNILTPIKNIITAAGKLGSAILPKLGSVVKTVTSNLDKFVPIALAAVAAIKGFQIAKTAATTLSMFVPALASCATGIGIAVAAIAALTVGLGAFNIMANKSSELNDKLSESLEGLTELTDDYQVTLDSINGSIESATLSIENENASVTDLVTELESLVDQNGVVKDGYQDRASVIINELNAAMGTEISMTDGVIDKYQEQIQAIKDLIAVQKAQALLEHTEDAYWEAYSKLEEKLNETAEALRVFNEAEEKYLKLTGMASTATNIYENDIKELFNQTDEGTKSLIEYIATLETGNVEADNFFQGLADGTITMEDLENGVYDITDVYKYLEDATAALNTEVENGTADYEAAKEELEELRSQLEEYQKTTANWEALSDALATGDIAAINEAYANLAANIATVANTSEEAVKTQMAEALKSVQSYLDLVADGTYKTGDEVGKRVTETMALAMGSYAELGAEAVAEVAKTNSDVIAEVIKADFAGTLSDEGSEGLTAFLDAFDDMDDKTRETLESEIKTALEGTGINEQLETKASEGGISYIEALRQSLEDGSITLDETMGATGASATTSFADSMVSNLSLVESSSGEVGKTAIAGVKTADSSSVGSDFVNDFSGSITDGASFAAISGKALATSADGGAGDVDSTNTGKDFAQSFATAIESCTASLRKVGQEIAVSAKVAAGSIETKTTGENFGSGFSGGISSMIGSAVSAASDLASSALSKIKSTLGINSPSKETEWVADMTVAGLVNNLLAGRTEAQKAGEALAVSALSGIQTGSELDFNSTMNLSAVANTDSLKYYIEDTMYNLASSIPTIDYDKLANAMSKQNIIVKYNDRELGRAVREVLV